MGDPSERLVTDLPIWADCPYQHSRKSLEIRRGKFTDDEPEQIVIWHPRARKHVSLSADGLSAEVFKRAKTFLLRFC